jgi:uncharacterized protein
VRYYGNRARVEVPRDEIARLTASPLRDELEAQLRSVGFTEVEIDPRGFRSGSLNDALRAT